LPKWGGDQGSKRKQTAYGKSGEVIRRIQKGKGRVGIIIPMIQDVGQEDSENIFLKR
jgi:hypothetical protein